MKYMLDTNICIYLIKEKPKNVLDKFNSLQIGDLCISIITFAELEYGVEKSNYPDQNRAALRAFLSPINILNFQQKEAIKYAQIRAELEKRGKIIGAYDLMIAAHALARNLILVTNNVGEFQRIPDLTIENWV